MKKVWLVMLGLGWVSVLCAAWAVKVPFLYQATVPVNSQSVTERNQAIPIALTQVLVKISGNDQILSNSKLQSRLNSAVNLVQEFGYSQSSTSTPYLLEIHFDVKGVNQWLQDASAPTWGQNRPLVSAWMTLATAQQPVEIIATDSEKVASLVKQHAERRGLPIILPIMDVTDLNQVSMQDIQNMDIPHLTNAAKRYGSNIILIGHMTQDVNGMTGQWKLVADNEQWEWTFSEKTLNDVLAKVIDNVTNTLGSRYAVITTNAIQKNISLKVTGVGQQVDFAQLVRYLNHLTPVADVGIVRITGNEIILSVSLRSTEHSFIQALSLGKKLSPIVNDENAPLLIYQWNH